MLSMRITGGKYCNRKVWIPEGELEIRPAMDRMRESLFSILWPLDGISFCDLFSGSGCVGLEAASRGAKRIRLVEMDRSKKDTMEKNISWAKDDCDIKIEFYDVLRYILVAREKFDIVYADPPFPMPQKIRILEEVADQNLVEKDGLFVVHIPAIEENEWPEEYKQFKLTDTRKYGRNMIKFYSVR